MDLSDRSVAILATDGFEYSELAAPRSALEEAGAKTKIISIAETADRIRGWSDGDWADAIDVDDTVSEADPALYDALVLPGGVLSPDSLRSNEEAVEFVRSFFEAGKPVAAICHGPWMIVEADAARGRRMTSYPSIRTDLENAGATWEDTAVVVDQGLVTSRSPDDLEHFIEKTLEEIGEGVHEGQRA